MPETMFPFLVGRDDELARVRDFLESPKGVHPRLLEIAGPAGIGKTALWTAGIDLARSHGIRVLAARPSESEQSLGLAALGDLLDDVLDDVFPGLPMPRRAALEIALLRRGRPGDSVDPRVLGAAVRSVLAMLGRDTTVLIAIDDVQWLDASSAEALWFAVRRLDGNDVRLMATRRSDSSLDTSSLASLGEVSRLNVGPLSLGALQTVMAQRLGKTLPRRALLRLTDVSGGNPLFALELASAWDAHDGPAADLPVPGKLEDLVRSRLDDLPARVQDALALVAVMGKVHDRIAAAADVAPDLDKAVAAEILHYGGGAYSFPQPLVASVLLGGLGASSRREIHARAAALVEDEVDAARHAAMATVVADASLAAQIDAAAGTAGERGAAGLAAELAHHALRLTPPDDVAATRRRVIAAIRASDAAGDRSIARTMTQGLVEASPAGSGRAEALVLLAELEQLGHSVEVLERALAEAEGHDALTAVIHRELAEQGRLTRGQSWAIKHARAAVECAGTVGDDALVAGCVSVLGLLLFRGADPEGESLARQAHALAREGSDADLVRRAASVEGLVLVWSGEIAAARELFERELAVWRDRDEPWTANIVWFLALVELQAGRWDDAEGYARQTYELDDQYGQSTPMSFYPLALLAAHRGDDERAVELARRALALADAQGVQLPGLIAVEGMLYAWAGRAEAACETLATASRLAEEVGIFEPGMLPWRAEEIESLLETGRIDDAAALLESWTADASRLRRRWVLATARRCEGLVLAARGDVGAAIATLESAVAGHEAVEDPFGKARALLALGAVKRKNRMKAPARADMEAARAAFAELGAAGWEQRAEAEIKRIGGRTKRDELSQVERRVADLVAAGKTNREIAAALFLSERTVASHLTRIYAKAGVRSRTELASKIQTF